MDDDLRELLRVLQTMAQRRVDSPVYQSLVDAVHARADTLLGECRWCRAGLHLSAHRPDWHVGAGGMRPCQRVSETVLPRPRHIWVEP